MYKRISFVLAVALAVNLFGMVDPTQADVEVPDVRGMTNYEAQSAITAAGLRVGNVSRTYSDTVPMHLIISQDPPGGTSVPIGSRVEFVISTGLWPSPEIIYLGGFWAPIELGVPFTIWINGEKFHPDITASISGPGTSISGQQYHINYYPGVAKLGVDVVFSSAAYNSTQTLTVTNPDGKSDSESFTVGTTMGQPVGWIRVPDVRGMAQADAESAITAAGLVCAISRVLYSDTVPEGYVISQRTRQETMVRVGSSVDLVISKGLPPDAVEVPDVVGIYDYLAQRTINSAGLVVERVSFEYSTVPRDLVISQGRAAGTVVPIGSSVYLVISDGLGPSPRITYLGGFSAPIELGVPFTIRVSGRYFHPDITASISGPGTSISDVRSYKSSYTGAVELRVDVVFSSAAYNSTQTLTVTNPDGKSNFASFIVGTTMARPVGWFKVPDVVGMSEHAAKQKITFRGLRVGDISYEYSDTVLYAQVISQDPKGGTSVCYGASVDLVIGGPQMVDVPDVVGMTYADAESAINSAGLSVGSIWCLYSDTVPAGCVISREPAAGTVVDPGTEVDLDISMGPEPRDVPPIPVRPDASCLLAHWKLDEIEGAIAYDSSGNGNHGMVYGNPIWQPTGGIIDGALEFDGNGDYVEVPKIGESVEFTYAMWVAQNQIGSGPIALIDHKDWVYGSVQFELRDGHPKVVINGAITPAGDLDAWGHTLAAGEWHHVALAKSATELLMYVDGEEAARKKLITSDTVILGDGFIGAWVNPAWGQTRYFDGWVDDVRIYDCTLDENQIKSLIITPPSPPDPLSEALDTTLSFTTGGSADWFSQTKTSYHDGDAAQSGDISGDQESWMQTTVSGKGTLKFYWKVSSEDDFDFLEFYIDGSLEDQISGSVSWPQKTYTISTSGSHVLEWRYMKDGATSFGDDCGWVDKVEWITTP